MRHIVLISTLLLASCNSALLNTGQEVTINLLGTDAAYCRLSTDQNRYSLDAPGTVFIERDAQNLTIDCDDNNSSRRRTLLVKSDFGLGYWNYPSEITIDFSTLDNGTRFNGFRVEGNGSESPELIIHRPDKRNPVITEVLTEDSYSYPVPTTQQYPVRKDYYMGRRSYPLTP